MTRRTLFAHLAALTLTCSAMPAAAQQEATQKDVIVCYALRLVPGEIDPARWGFVHHPPKVVALDSTPVKRREGWPAFRLRPPIGGRDPWPDMVPAWRMLGDTLEMYWNNGLTGVRLRGRVAAPRFGGIATIVTDVVTGSRPATARFEAEVVACPAELVGGTKQ